MISGITKQHTIKTGVNNLIITNLPRDKVVLNNQNVLEIRHKQLATTQGKTVVRNLPRQKLVSSI